MSIIEWIWLIVAAGGAVMAFNAWRAKLDFHGAGMARAAGIRFGVGIALIGAVGFVIAWLIP